MLVVMRKSGQSLIIGKDIEIHILDVQANGVKVGIKAPKEISILRYELINEAKIANKESALTSSKVDLAQLKEVIDE